MAKVVTESSFVNGKSVVGQIVSKVDKTEVPEAKQSMILESLCTGKNLCVSSFRNHYNKFKKKWN